MSVAVLTSDEEKCVKLFLDHLNKVRSQHKVSPVSRSTAIRFLMARKFDILRALELFELHVSMRSQEGLAKVPLDQRMVQLELESGKFTVLPHRDSHGAAIALFTAKLHQPEATNHQSVLRAVVHQLDQALADGPTQRQGLVLVYNMLESGYANFDRTLSQKLLTVLKGAYPARLKRVYIVAAPFWFRAPYNFLSFFIKEKLKERVSLVGVDELTLHLPAHSLPTGLGGSLEVDHWQWLKHCSASATASACLRLEQEYEGGERALLANKAAVLVAVDLLPPRPLRAQNGRRPLVPEPPLPPARTAPPTTPADGQRHRQHLPPGGDAPHATLQLQPADQGSQGSQGSHEKADSECSYLEELIMDEEEEEEGEEGHRPGEGGEAQANCSGDKRLSSGKANQPLPPTPCEPELTPPRQAPNKPLPPPPANRMDSSGSSEDDLSSTSSASDPSSPPPVAPRPRESFADYQSIHQADGDGMTVGKVVAHLNGIHKTGIYKEYARIRLESPAGAFTISKSKSNGNRNRYTDVLAYDHSRVKLAVDGTTNKSNDYINANFVDGYRQKNAFIATQGPLSNTSSDYWRMVWEQRVYIVVMTTRTIERGRTKCGQYWPLEEGTNDLYGDLTISNLLMESSRDYTLTTLQIKHNQTGECRNLMHFQFISWPDFGVPNSAAAMLDFLAEVRHHQAKFVDSLGRSWTGPPGGPPIIVHCSAGIGRTGTFCTLDICLARLADIGTVDVYNTVRRMRRQRAFSIQTPDQYEFCHFAVIEHAQRVGVLPTVDLSLYDDTEDSD